MVAWRTWREAMADALYGERGFYRTTAPSAHFRTSVHVSRAFAAALLRLARLAELRTVVDLGAGQGELVTTLHDLAPDLELIAVEIRDRPDELPRGIEWVPEVPDGVHGLIVANEWLDNVPLDLLDGGHLVEVDPKGTERPGPAMSDRDRAWRDTWWPASSAELGWPRDDAWAAVIASLAEGIAVAIDYGHTRDTRPEGPTLAAYRDGRMVTPVPDGSCDLTAWVAMDAVRAAGEAAGATRSTISTQRDALEALGVKGGRPPLAQASRDPTGYLAALSQASEVSELRDPRGLGGFVWLVQVKGTELPLELAV